MTSLLKYSASYFRTTMELGVLDFTLTFLALALTLRIYSTLSSRSRLRPPGPRQVPILGNILQIPVDSAWKVYQGWGRQFGKS